jgi:hypothetical protein
LQRLQNRKGISGTDLSAPVAVENAFVDIAMARPSLAPHLLNEAEVI